MARGKFGGLWLWRDEVYVYPRKLRTWFFVPEDKEHGNCLIHTAIIPASDK